MFNTNIPTTNKKKVIQKNNIWYKQNPITGSKGIGNHFNEQRLTLRIHRGRDLNKNQHDSLRSVGSTHSNHGGTTTTTNTTTSTTTGNSTETERLSRNPTPKRHSHKKLKGTSSYPSTTTTTTTDGGGGGGVSCVSPSQPGTPTNTQNLSPINNSSDDRDNTDGFIIEDIKEEEPKYGIRHMMPFVSERTRDLSPKSSKIRRNLKLQVKRFKMETKAAKTLAIIVGGFIVCWLPFFTMYLIRAFCNECIPPLIFSILFWLGYCNSAINPVIYALFSKEFRLAFTRIICKFFCSKHISSINRRDSDGSQRIPRPSPLMAALTSLPFVDSSIKDVRLRWSSLSIKENNTSSIKQHHHNGVVMTQSQSQSQNQQTQQTNRRRSVVLIECPTYIHKKENKKSLVTKV